MLGYDFIATQKSLTQPTNVRSYFLPAPYSVRVNILERLI